MGESSALNRPVLTLTLTLNLTLISSDAAIGPNRTYSNLLTDPREGTSAQPNPR
jgi:hypothetical protein